MTSADGAVRVGDEIGSGAMWPMDLRGETLFPPFGLMSSASVPTFPSIVASGGMILVGIFDGVLNIFEPSSLMLTSDFAGKNFSAGVFFSFFFLVSFSLDSDPEKDDD